MGGFASLIGGAGQEASRYGQQVRGILEQRREGLAQIMSQLASQEPDLQKRGEYFGIVSKLYSGQDMSKALPAVIKSVQTGIQSSQALAKAVGGPPGQPQPKPGLAQVGQTQGTPQQPADGAAAQPSTSPVQPIAQGQQDDGSPDALRNLIAQPSGGPSPETQAAVGQPPTAPPQAQSTPNLSAVTPMAGGEEYSLPDQIGGIPISDLVHTPVGRAMLQPYLTSEAGFREKKAYDNLELANKRKSLENYKSSPDYNSLPPYEKAQMELWASTPGQSLPSMYGMAHLMSPYKESVNAATLESRYPGILKQYKIDASKTPTVIITRSNMDPGGYPISVEATTPGMQTVISPDGTQAVVPKVPGKLESSPGIPAVAPNQVAPIREPTASGEVEKTTAADLAAGKPPTVIPGAVTPSMASTESTKVRNVSTVDDQNRPVTVQVPVTESSRKVMPGPQGSNTPQPNSQPASKEFLRPLTAATQTMKETAPKVMELADKVVADVQSQINQLGPLRSRWSDFWSGTVGEPNPQFRTMMLDSSLLSTLVMRMHQGSRGSQVIMQHYLDLLGSGHQSPENMIAAATALKTYANSILSEGPKDIVPKQLQVIKTQQEFDALPSGATYKEEDGKTYRKP